MEVHAHFAIQTVLLAMGVPLHNATNVRKLATFSGMEHNALPAPQDVVFAMDLQSLNIFNVALDTLTLLGLISVSKIANTLLSRAPMLVAIISALPLALPLNISTGIEAVLTLAMPHFSRGLS